MSRFLKQTSLFLVLLLGIAGCDGTVSAVDDAVDETVAEKPTNASSSADTDNKDGAEDVKEKKAAPSNAGDKKVAGDKKGTDMPKLDTITFGAGCFWCIEAVLDRIEGIEEVTSGYMGGKTINPTYKDICTGLTGHAEVVEVKFDPKKLPLEKLLDIFWQLHDPTTLNRQGPDVGTQYRSAIFYSSEATKKAAEASKKKWNESRKFRGKIVTEITEASTFYPAEDYHQEYFAKNPNDRYCRYNILPKFKKLGLMKKSDR